MTSIEGTSRDAFLAMNASRELNLGMPEEFPVDLVSSNLETAKRLEKEAEVRKRAVAEASGKCKCDIGDVLMSTLAISAVVAAAVGVAFIIVKELKHM